MFQYLDIITIVNIGLKSIVIVIFSLSPRPNLYCVYALVGGAISIRDPYICAVSRVCANGSHAVFHGPVVCVVKT